MQATEKTILWISKELPPQIVGATFETNKSGKPGITQWQNKNYTMVMVDSGALMDGLNGFDVVRTLRALNSTATVYLMATNVSPPDTMWAQRLKANGLIRRTTTEITEVLRKSNAINWGVKPGMPKSTPAPAPANASLTARLLNLFRSETQSSKVETMPTSMAEPDVDVSDIEVSIPVIHAPPVFNGTSMSSENVRGQEEHVTLRKQNLAFSQQKISSDAASSATKTPVKDEISLDSLARDIEALAELSSATPSIQEDLDTQIALRNITSASENAMIFAKPEPQAQPFSTQDAFGKRPVARNINNPHSLKLLNFKKLGEDYREADRQFAWELYTELSTRVSVTGKASDPTCTKTDGELWFESFAGLLAFCKELRILLRTFPAAHTSGSPHLGGLLVEITRVVLNPFLDKWRVDYLQWWEYASDKTKPPSIRQEEYPRTQEMLVEWRELKMTLRAVQETVGKAYNLI